MTEVGENGWCSNRNPSGKMQTSLTKSMWMRIFQEKPNYDHNSIREQWSITESKGNISSLKIGKTLLSNRWNGTVCPSCLLYIYIDSLSHPFSNVHIKYDSSNLYCLVNEIVMPRCWCTLGRKSFSTHTRFLFFFLWLLLCVWLKDVLISIQRRRQRAIH